jgi:ubiquinone/menaquinone biosynthesis C-methylase UbiE
VERILEPELMDDEAQAGAYARADFSTSNQLFVDGLLGNLPRDPRSAIDLGCGPGDVAIRLARAAPQLTVTALDGSASMIALAREAVREAGLDERIALRCDSLPARGLPDRSFDAVLSKDTLHHLPDPLMLWREVLRLGRPEGVVHVMDLVRPDSPDDARRIVESVAGREPEILKRDFYNSLCAAFTLDEVRRQLAAVALPLAVELAGGRHWLVRSHRGFTRP